MRAYREILTIPGAWQFSAAGLIALGSWRALRRAVTPDRAPVG
ncbi:MAG: hypothetical protein R2719_06595 [Micropruina sp.]